MHSPPHEPTQPVPDPGEDEALSLLMSDARRALGAMRRATRRAENVLKDYVVTFAIPPEVLEEVQETWGKNLDAKKKALELALSRDEEHANLRAEVRRLEHAMDMLEDELENLKDARREREQMTWAQLAGVVTGFGHSPGGFPGSKALRLAFEQATRVALMEAGVEAGVTDGRAEDDGAKDDGATDERVDPPGPPPEEEIPF